MARILGIGGIFYKTENHRELLKWYTDVLGLEPGEGYNGTEFHWRREDDPKEREMTLWSFFDEKTSYLDPSDKPFMVNFIVDDLDGMLEKLRAAGTTIVGDVIEDECGRFAHFLDPSGAKMELWQPPTRKG